MKKLLILFTIFLSLTAVAQEETFYLLPNGEIMNEASFDKLKASLKDMGDVKADFISTIRRNDSVIKRTKLVITEKSDRKPFDPFAIHREKIGEKFVLEDFKKADGSVLTLKDLGGKSTVLNFWFTSCAPCISEMPKLNSLKKQMRGDVNFIAITFNEKSRVDEFLKTTKFDFDHITDARKQIDSLRIQAFPMTILLDKNAFIKNVYGDLTYQMNDLKSDLRKVM